MSSLNLTRKLFVTCSDRGQQECHSIGWAQPMFSEYGWTSLLTTLSILFPWRLCISNSIYKRIWFTRGRESLLSAEDQQPNSKAFYKTGKIAFQFHLNLWKTNMLTIVTHIHGGNSIISCHWVYKLFKTVEWKKKIKTYSGGKWEVSSERWWHREPKCCMVQALQTKNYCVSNTIDFFCSWYFNLGAVCLWVYAHCQEEIW